MGYWKDQQLLRFEHNGRLRSGRASFVDADDLAEVAELLGGDVDDNARDNFIRCPSPGFPRLDRSCHVRIDNVTWSHDGKINHVDFFVYSSGTPDGRAYAMSRATLRHWLPSEP
jgi:hypothetical protein